MKAILDGEIQIEITNACHNQCSNCTRLCGHHKNPFFMQYDEFVAAVESVVNFPNLVGVMGGEPLLHPEFERLCEYLRTKIPRDRLGLWTCLPAGKEHYREAIVSTFGSIFINDHTRTDILHAPVLVASEEVELPGWHKDYLIHHCWVQNTWSASITPRGAFFCEVAAAIAEALDIKGLGWELTAGWWGRSPQHFIEQMKLCHYCGCAMPLKRRKSTDVVDDISPKMYERLIETSPKLRAGKFALNDCKPVQCAEEKLATYKDQSYRDAIAKRYGIFLTLNNRKYCEPHLMRSFQPKEN